MDEKYRADEERLHKKASRGWVGGCVRGCVDFETPGRLPVGLEPSNSFNIVLGEGSSEKWNKRAVTYCAKKRRTSVRQN